MKMMILAMLVLLALPGLGYAAPPTSDSGGVQGAEVASADWVVKAEDNVCGVSNARQITFPAKVRYDALMRATPEMKEMKSKGIDKNSPRGIRLVSDAKARILTAAKAVMSDNGHCSVWKKILHKRGTSATDITDAVLLKLEP